MPEMVAIASFAFSSVSFLLAVSALLLHYAKRAQNPLTGPLEAEINALKVGQADIVDRVEHWMKRDRARRVRAEVDDSPPTPTGIPEPPPGVIDKQTIRSVARTRGLVR